MSNSFIEIPASKQSLAQRGLVYGVGLNDAAYMTQQLVNGKRLQCPFYLKWRSMIARCYDKKYQENFPTYLGCTVCNDWLKFSAFKAWMVKQDWEGMQLDKDIRVQGNKIYGPEFCSFVTNEANSIEAHAKRFRFINPEGRLVEIYNLTVHCKENNLNRGNMWSVHKGNIPHAKGWTKAPD